MSKLRRNYLIFLAVMTLLFATAGARGFRVLSVLSTAAWVHSGTAPIHK